MRALAAIVVVLLASSLMGCADVPQAEKPKDAFALVDQMVLELNGTCQYPVLEKHRNNEKFMCYLHAIAKRCNKIDDCYVYCIGNDVGVEIGGGCNHLCNYGGKEKWSPPDEAKACFEG